MKIIEINVNFPFYCPHPWMILLEAIRERLPDIKIFKYRYTYFESNYGTCDFPPGLILSQVMEKHGPLDSFSSHIIKCSGTYRLEFK